MQSRVEHRANQWPLLGSGRCHTNTTRWFAENRLVHILTGTELMFAMFTWILNQERSPCLIDIHPI